MNEDEKTLKEKFLQSSKRREKLDHKRYVI